MEEYDLEEQQQEEQFKEDFLDTPSKEVRKQLKELQQFEKLAERKNKQKVKKAAKFTRLNNMNHYECDNCGELFQEETGSLIYKKEGEFAYCGECLKKLYPGYKKVYLVNSVKKTDYLSNHYDTQYFNRL